MGFYESDYMRRQFGGFEGVGGGECELCDNEPSVLGVAGLSGGGSDRVRGNAFVVYSASCGGLSGGTAGVAGGWGVFLKYGGYVSIARRELCVMQWISRGRGSEGWGARQVEIWSAGEGDSVFRCKKERNKEQGGDWDTVAFGVCIAGGWMVFTAGYYLAQAESASGVC